MTGNRAARVPYRPNPSDPPVCKLRLRYAKRGRLRFISHRDIARILERALRRAGVPMAYSQGFSPHPKVSWVGAAPTGTASEAEYVEIALVAVPDPEAVRRELDAALPDGLAVVEAVVAGPGGLADRIDASQWRIELPEVPVETLQAAVRALLAADQVPVERRTKSGSRMLDVRSALAAVEVGGRADTPPGGRADTPLGGRADTPTAPVGSPGSAGRAECGILDMVVTQGAPAVRPDDVVSALGVVAGLQPPVPAKATRTAQGRLDGDGNLVDPLDPDRSGDGVSEPPTGGAARHSGWPDSGNNR